MAHEPTKLRPAKLREVDGEIPKNGAFLVRVIRLWAVPSRDDPESIRSVEIVLQDDEKIRIQASVDPNLWDQTLKDKITEHGLYGMKNFRVMPNNVQFKPAPHPYRLFFHERTKVSPYDLSKFGNFPRMLYDTRTVSEILSIPENNAPNLIDFIGMLDPKERLRVVRRTATTSNNLSFHLKDLEMNQIYCTLWEGYADDAAGKIPGKRNLPIVVLLQLCRVKRDRGVTLATSFHVSKVLIDYHIPEIEEFRNSFSAMERTLSQGSSSNSKGRYGPMMKLSKLYNSIEFKGYCFYGVITTVLSKVGWSYAACSNPRCFKKMEQDGDEYVCRTCGRRLLEPMYKYCVRLEVEDNGSVITVSLWDDECQRLFGKTANELRIEVDENNGIESCPKEILDLEKKNFLFKIDSSIPSIKSKGGRIYSCSNLCDDQELIASMTQDDGDKLEGDDSDDDLDLLFNIGVANDSSVTNLEADKEDSNTPLSKRRLDEDDDHNGNTPPTQNSSNKKMKSIKIEKA